MAWTSPKTWTASTMLTAAELNEQLRDNLAETMPAKATTASAWFCVDQENSIAERVIKSSRVLTTELRSSTSYGDLSTVGPSVTCETGPAALVMFSSRIDNDTANAQGLVSYKVSGATTSAAADSRAIITDGLGAGSPLQLGMWDLITTLTPGENTFTLQYRAGGAGTAQFFRRYITVLPL